MFIFVLLALSVVQVSFVESVIDYNHGYRYHMERDFGDRCYDCLSRALYGACEYKHCKKCSPGHYFTNESCWKCQPGYAQPNKGMTSCIQCKPGSYADGYGFTKCKQCPKGFVQPNYGKDFCYGCWPGTYMNETGKTKCYKASVNYFVAKEHQRFQEKCLQDEYNKEEGMHQCLKYSRNIGCFYKIKELSKRNTHYVVKIDNMTLDKCYVKCNTKFYGVFNGKFCYCYHRNAIFSKPGYAGDICPNSILCNGNKTEHCGNNNATQTYEVMVKKVTTNYMRLGCYQDNKDKRDMQYLMTIKDNSVEKCYRHCKHVKAKKFKMFGVQKTSCFCGNSYGSYGKVSKNAANWCDTYRCPGNWYDYCGGFLRSMIYIILV